MKKYSLLFFLFIVMRSSAQEILVALHLEGKAGYTHGTSFQKFVDSYNALNNTNKTKLGNFGPTTGYSFGADAIQHGILIGYYQHRVSATASSKVNDYYSREFRFKQNTYGADFGYGKNKKTIGIIGFLGIYVANINIISDFKYRDGYRSIGTEGSLNLPVPLVLPPLSAGARYLVPVRSRILYTINSYPKTGVPILQPVVMLIIKGNMFRHIFNPFI